MTATMHTHTNPDTLAEAGGVVAPSSDTGHRGYVAHDGDAWSDTLSTDTGHSDPAILAALAGSVDPSPSPPTVLTQAADVPVEWAAFDGLRVYAECLADAMDHRIALANRLRSGTVPGDVVAELLADLTHTEKLLRKGMVKSFRTAAPEVAAWTKDTVGLGEETMARLIGSIGHPVIARPHHWEGEGSTRTLVADEPFLRSVSQLWSYCGHGDPARRKRKGMTADDAMGLGSPHAKKLVYLLAVGCMKCAGTVERPPATVIGPTPMETASLVDPLTPTGHCPSDTHPPTAGVASLENVDANLGPIPEHAARRRSPYRDTYDARRLVTADREDWTPGHKHADAIRLTGKAILRDLWVVSRTAMEDQ